MYRKCNSAQDQLRLITNVSSKILWVPEVLLDQPKRTKRMRTRKAYGTQG